jgi:hypoxanthine phosphoribosyltransferase
VAERAAALTILLPAGEVAARVDALAGRLAPHLEGGAVGLTLLLGGMWFAADLSRALAARGASLETDAIWLASYGEGRVSGGACEVLAGPRRPLAGRTVLIMDDVIDSGLTIAHAEAMARGAGAARVITAVFARKPWPAPRALEPDHAAWEAPDRFLVGYGMDLAGALRELPWIAAAD